MLLEVGEAKIRVSHLCNKKCPKVSKKCATIAGNSICHEYNLEYTCLSTFCTFQDFGNEYIYDRGHFNSKNKNKNLKMFSQKWTKGCPFDLVVSNRFDPPVSVDWQR